MKKEEFEILVKKEFPHLKWNESRFTASGWDHFIIILDGEIVFRIPKDERYEAAFTQELKLIEYLNSYIKTNIPDYIYTAKDRSFAGYKKLQGIEMSKQFFDTLSEVQKESFAEQISVFLTELHTFPAKLQEKYSIRTCDYMRAFESMRENTEKLIYPEFSKTEIRITENFFEEYGHMISKEYGSVLLHNDLSGEHIIWDRRENKIGIIDFSDREFGDPAFDFTGLTEYGDKFVSRVITLYGLEKDDGFLYRAKMYYKRVPFYIMIDSFNGFPCTFKEGYDMFKKVFGEDK